MPALIRLNEESARDKALYRRQMRFQPVLLASLPPVGG